MSYNDACLRNTGIVIILAAMYTIESGVLKVIIQPKGAELKSICHKQYNLEYMWNANPAFWGKSSPVLFPIVGTLKNNQYSFEGKTYELLRHGFARDKEFMVEQQSPSSIHFSISSDAATLKIYPFSFKFSIVYTVHENRLTVKYVVQNAGEEPMYFSVGGHPAFKLPLVEGTSYNDYKLVFEKNETAGRWPITKDGLIDSSPQALLTNENELPLTKDLFQKDAVVLKRLASNSVTLLSDKTEHGLTFDFKGFPFLGLWAAPGADFVCIEPWCGIADRVDSNGNLADKKGINKLAGKAAFSIAWSVACF